MAEWLIAAVLKTVVHLVHRGFESLSLRLNKKISLTGGVPEWTIGAAC
jgi:hypothetical protein